jgi:hypothetical protein
MGLETPQTKEAMWVTTPTLTEDAKRQLDALSATWSGNRPRWDLYAGRAASRKSGKVTRHYDQYCPKLRASRLVRWSADLSSLVDSPLCPACVNIAALTADRKAELAFAYAYAGVQAYGEYARLSESGHYGNGVVIAQAHTALRLIRTAESLGNTASVLADVRYRIEDSFTASVDEQRLPAARTIAVLSAPLVTVDDELRAAFKVLRPMNGIAAVKDCIDVYTLGLTNALKEGRVVEVAHERGMAGAYFRQSWRIDLSQLPDELQLDRAEYASTEAWLEAEWRLAAALAERVVAQRLLDAARARTQDVDAAPTTMIAIDGPAARLGEHLGIAALWPCTQDPAKEFAVGIVPAQVAEYLTTLLPEKDANGKRSTTKAKVTILGPAPTTGDPADLAALTVAVFDRDGACSTPVKAYHAAQLLA